MAVDSTITFRLAAPVSCFLISFGFIVIGFRGGGSGILEGSRFGAGFFVAAGKVVVGVEVGGLFERGGGVGAGTEAGGGAGGGGGNDGAAFGGGFLCDQDLGGGGRTRELELTEKGGVFGDFRGAVKTIISNWISIAIPD